MPNHHKLVRDRIPEIIRDSGRACEVEVLSPDAYVQALRSKLVEEAQEAAAIDATPEFRYDVLIVDGGGDLFRLT